MSFLPLQLLREPCSFLRKLSYISLKCSFLVSQVLHFPLQASIFLRERSHISLKCSFLASDVLNSLCRRAFS
jgi:hypothetical protein